MISPTRFPRFYPVLPDVDWLERLVPLGLQVVQLRIKGRPMAQVRAQIVRARELCAAHGCQLIVNDYWQAAIELGCDYIHLGQEDLAAADLAAIRRAGLRLGLSSHDQAELATALAAEPDYVALGPIYPTKLKKMKWAPQGLERVGIWARQVAPLPLVAIGGITLQRAAGVFAAGAHTIAVVSDLITHERPEQRVADWLATFEKEIGEEGAGVKESVDEKASASGRKR